MYHIIHKSPAMDLQTSVKLSERREPGSVMSDHDTFKLALKCTQRRMGELGARSLNISGLEIEIFPSK